MEVKQLEMQQFVPLAGLTKRPGLLQERREFAPYMGRAVGFQS
jgi:hypothetical protein